MGAAYLSIKSLSKGVDHPKNALRHNLREIQAELGSDKHIDPTRTHLNQVVFGHKTSHEAQAQRMAILKDNGIDRYRKNAVHAIEILVSICPLAEVDQLEFFIAARDWIHSNFGGHMLHAVIHNDEEAPHMHIIILPIVNQKMNGSALMGDRKQLQKLQTAFYEQVSKNFGFSKPRSKNNPDQEVIEQLLNTIQSQPQVWTQADFQNVVIQEMIKKPIALIKFFRIKPHWSNNPFTKIMTKPVKPEPKF